MGSVVEIKELIEIKEILERIGVPYFLVGSMVLAVFRDKDFLPGDQDLDIGILNEYIYYHDQIREELKKAGWKIRIEEDQKGPRIDAEKTENGNYWSLNIHYFKKYETYRWSSIFSLCQLYDAEIFEKVSLFDFKGLQLPLPGEPEKYLEAEYGDWKVPQTLEGHKPEGFYKSISRANDFKLWEKIEEIVTQSRKKVGYAFVVADLLHCGHIRFLKNCKLSCDYLIVGVYTDELTQTYKRRPIIPFEQRKELVENLKIVDKVVKVEDKDCTPMLKKLTEEGWRIKYLFHGDDWKIVAGEEYIKQLGGELILIPYTQWISTSEIIRRIKSEPDAK